MPSPERRILLRAFRAAVDAADPTKAMRGRWPAPPSEREARIVVLAVGKAAGAMARAAWTAYEADRHRLTGVVVVPPGATPVDAGPWEIVTGDHPVPGRASARAGRALVEAASAARDGDLVLALISGGGSALAVVPREGMTLEEVADLFATMTRKGMDVRDMNLVRRHADLLKGGGLARLASPAIVRSFVVSDVVGDDPADVASGPTVVTERDPRTVLALLDRHGVDAPALRRLLAAELDTPPTHGSIGATPGTSVAASTDLTTEVVVSARSCLEAARRSLEADGATVRSVDVEVIGDARTAAETLAAEIVQVVGERRGGGLRSHAFASPSPIALVSGGETTVHVRGQGTGGRNQTFALALALALPPGAPVHALVADSDGIDGVGGAAGAFVGPQTFDVVSRSEARALLAGDDSGGFFRANGDALVTGPTGTNVNDVRLVWIAPATVPGRSDPCHAPVAPSDVTKGPTVVPATPEAIASAAGALAQGRLVAVPTETVYGLAGLARDPRAVEAIFATKGRPLDHPVIVHVGEAGWLHAWTDAPPEITDPLVARFWPGPLTLVMPARSDVPRSITGGQDTVAVRMPSHPVALDLLRALGEAVVAPSANRFGHVSPTTAAHVVSEFPDVDLMVVDGGACDVGVESTILDLSGSVPRVLRPGAVTLEEIRQVAPAAVAAVLPTSAPTSAPTNAPTNAATDAATEVPRVPGALDRHYAPRSPTDVVVGTVLRATGPGDREAALLVTTYDVPAGHRGAVVRLDLHPVAYARGLYAALRQLDAERPSRIVVERPPDGPAWTAVHDRLRRAASGGAPDVRASCGAGAKREFAKGEGGEGEETT